MADQKWAADERKLASAYGTFRFSRQTIHPANASSKAGLVNVSSQLLVLL
jgi:hypothetical protein